MLSRTLFVARRTYSVLGDERARELIYGPKLRSEFTGEERELVDSLQRELLKESGELILPKTYAEVEQEEFDRYLEERSKSK